MYTGLVSEHPAAVNMLTGLTQCRTLQKQPFILRFHRYERGRTGKRPFQSDLKSQLCMLTHCLPMPGIVALMWRISRKRLKCIYPKNQNLFVNILMHFLNLHKIWKIFILKVKPHSLSISEVIHCEKRRCLNAFTFCYRRCCGSQCVNGLHTL